MVISVSRSILYSARKFALATVASIALAGCQSAVDPELATTTDPEPISGFLRTAAVTSQGARDYASAVGYYQSLYARDPSDPEVVLGLARNLRFIGSAEQSLDILRAALLEHPDRTDLKAEAGKTLLAVGETEAAVETLLEVAQAEPENWQVKSALGIAYDQLKEYDRAQAQYHAALEISPKNVNIFNNLALSKALSGDLNEGLAILKRTMGMRKAGVQVRQNLALLYAMQGDMETAERLIKQDLPAEMAEQNIEYYERVYSGEFTNPSVALSEELSPERRLTMDESNTAVIEPASNETVVGSVESARLEPEVAAPTAALRTAVAGIPDIDATTEPISVVEAGFEDHEGAAPVLPRLVAGLDADAGRQSMQYTGADLVDSEFSTPASRPLLAPAIAVAAIPDVDNAAEPVGAVLSGFEDQEGAAPVAPRLIAGLDADAGRQPMQYAGTDLSDSGFEGTASRPLMPAPVAAAAVPDVDNAAVPVSVDMAGFEDREGAAPVAPRVVAGLDADAGRQPVLYRDAVVADRSTDGVAKPAGALAGAPTDSLISVAETGDTSATGNSDSDDLEFDLGDAEEAVIATATDGTFKATGLGTRESTPEDAAPADTDVQSDDILTNVLAQFVGRTVTPTETDVADASEPSRSFAYGAGRAMGRPRAGDRTPTETAPTQPAPNADAPVVAALTPVPPAPNVGGESTAISRDIMLQFGAFPSLGEATRWLVALRKSHADLLSGVRFQIKSTDDGPVDSRYRLIAGPIESEAAAADLCKRLEGFRDNCRILDPADGFAKVKASLEG